MVTFYAYALKNGKLSQIKESRNNGKMVSRIYTGKTYKTLKDATLDMVKLNCNGIVC